MCTCPIPCMQCHACAVRKCRLQSVAEQMIGTESRTTQHTLRSAAAAHHNEADGNGKRHNTRVWHKHSACSCCCPCWGNCITATTISSTTHNRTQTTNTSQGPQTPNMRPILQKDTPPRLRQPEKQQRRTHASRNAETLLRHGSWCVLELRNATLRHKKEVMMPRVNQGNATCHMTATGGRAPECRHHCSMSLTL
jgi:hypothetical protein